MIFQSYFAYLRGRATLAKDRKTIRMLESLIRLAEAHARLMFKTDIEVFDAINVIILMEHCINTGLFQKTYSCYLSPEMYAMAKDEVFKGLGLEPDPKYFQDSYDIYESPDQQTNRKPRKNPVNGEDTYLIVND